MVSSVASWWKRAADAGTTSHDSLRAALISLQTSVHICGFETAGVSAS